MDTKVRMGVGAINNGSGAMSFSCMDVHQAWLIEIGHQKYRS